METSPSTPRRVATTALLIGAFVATLVALPSILLGIFGPVKWVAAIWTGNSRVPMKDQLPFAAAHHFDLAAISLVAFALAIGLYGRATNCRRWTSRAAMALTGGAVYFALLSTSLSYVATRTTFSLLAMALILGARLIRRLRPLKTILFFIGVGFTTEALIWSLANSAATIAGFGIFSVMCAFFTVIDKKRRIKTIYWGGAGLSIFAIAVSSRFRLSNVVPLLAIALILLAGQELIRTERTKRLQNEKG